MLLQSIAIAWLAGSALAAFGLPGWTGVFAGLLASPLIRGRAGGFETRPYRAAITGRIAITAAAAVSLAAVSLAGVAWYQGHQPSKSPTDVSRFIGDGPTRVRGVVEGDRDERERSLLLRLRVSSVEDDSGWHAAEGLILLRVPLALDYDDGDLLEARGKPIRPRAAQGFDYPAYLARQGVFAEMDYPGTRLLAKNAGPAWRHGLVRLREQLAAGIASVLPEPEASLGAGIALGTRRVIEPELNQALTETGTAQIIVASGYNITVVAALTLGALAWLLGRRWASLLTLAAIAGYAIFVGLYPSIVRASIMGAIVVFAGLAGRPHSGTRALLIASAIMVAISPLALNDLSFLLSLFGTAGLFLFAQPLSTWIVRAIAALGPNPEPLTRRGRRPSPRPSPNLGRGGLDGNIVVRGVVASASTTLAATAGTVPVIAAAFHTLSLSSLPANLILFPAVPAIMAASGATAVAGAVWHPAAVVLAPVAYGLLAFMVLVVRFCARLPGSQLPLPWFGARHAAATLAVLGLAAFVGPRVWAMLRDLSPGPSPDIGRGKTSSLGGWFRRWQTRAGAESAVLGAGDALEARGPGGRGLLNHKLVPAAGIGAALAVAFVAVALAMFFVSRAHGSALTVTYLDVGAGSAILVQAGGQRVLINGGPPGEAAVRALDRALPPWQRSLNIVIVTDAADENIGGLPAVLSRYRVGSVLDASGSGRGELRVGPAWRDWQKAEAQTGVMRLPEAAVTSFRLGGWLIRVEQTPLTPPLSQRGSDVSIAATVIAERGAHRFVLAGDQRADVSAELRSVNRGNASTPPVQPLVTVRETEARDHSPGPSALTPGPSPNPGRGEIAQTLVYRTADNGDITIEASAEGLRVRVARGPRMGLGR